jgi:hypothetical protein
MPAGCSEAAELTPQSNPYASVVGYLVALRARVGVLPLLRPELLATGPVKEMRLL